MLIRGAELAVEETGDASSPRTVVWGHGLTRSRRLEDVEPLLDLARLPARVVRYDARGHGESSSPPDLAGYGWDELALDQLAIADELGVGRYVAAGASMGAATALHAAVAAPGRIEALVLVIPPTGWETRAAQIELYDERARLVESDGVEAVIEAGAAIAPPDPFRGDADHERRRAEAMRSWDPSRLALVLRGAGRAQLPDRAAIAAIDRPALVLGWTGDPGHPTTTIDELSTLLPHAEVHVASTAADLAGWTDLTAAFLAALR